MFRSGLAVVGATVLCASGCGDGVAERKARAAVCSGRADIHATIARLRATPAARVRNAKVTEEVQSILADVASMRKQVSSLSGSERRLVWTGTATFEALAAQLDLGRPEGFDWEANPVGNMRSLNETLDGMVHKTLSKIDC